MHRDMTDAVPGVPVVQPHRLLVPPSPKWTNPSLRVLSGPWRQKNTLYCEATEQLVIS